MLDTLHALCGYRIPPLGHATYRLFRKYGPKTLDTRLFPTIRARLDFADSDQFDTWWQGGRYEKPTCAIFRKWLAGASHFFDIGSNYGFFTWLAMDARPGLRADAFEPHPKTFATLDAIRKENGLAPRLGCWNMGLGDREETLALHPEEGMLGQTTFVPGAGSPDSGIPVPVRPFDAWRREHGPALPGAPAWIAKIDVEGFEPRVIRGMEEALRARAFAGLVVEINEETLARAGSSPAEFRGLLGELGYRAETERTEPLLRGRRPSPIANDFFVPA